MPAHKTFSKESAQQTNATIGSRKFAGRKKNALGNKIRMKPDAMRTGSTTSFRQAAKKEKTGKTIQGICGGWRKEKKRNAKQRVPAHNFTIWSKNKKWESQTVQYAAQLVPSGAKARNGNPKRYTTQRNLFQVEQKKPSGKVAVPKWNKSKDAEQLRVQNRDKCGSDAGKYRDNEGKIRVLYRDGSGTKPRHFPVRSVNDPSLSRDNPG